jgi:hypothetical protein
MGYWISRTQNFLGRTSGKFIVVCGIEDAGFGRHHPGDALSLRLARCRNGNGQVLKTLAGM